MIAGLSALHTFLIFLFHLVFGLGCTLFSFRLLIYKDLKVLYSVFVILSDHVDIYAASLAEKECVCLFSVHEGQDS